MFDEQTNGTVINPSANAAAAALTLAMLNSTAGVGGTNISTGSVSAIAPQLSLQLNQSQQQLTQLLAGKDSRWLQLEICREYQRGQCVRSEQDCKYAHPPSNVEIQNGRVTACFDSIKGRCSRENPKCKYLHPPQHLKDQLLANGKQNLVMKNLLSQQYSNQIPAMPTLAQITQQQYNNPLALQSALSLPYFVPSLYPGQASLVSPSDPFTAAFQGSQAVSLGAHPSVASPFPLHNSTTLAHLAIIQQQQPAAAAAMLLQQQAAQQQYIALLQQQQQLNAATILQASVAAQSNRSSSSGNDNTEQQPTIGGNRKRGARIAGLDQQQSSNAEGAGCSSSILGQQQHLQLMAAVAAVSTNNANSYISVTTTGNMTKRQKTEVCAASTSGNGGFKCTPTTIAFGMPLYAAPQFNPYLLPTAPFLPAVPFSGQLPRFH